MPSEKDSFVTAAVRAVVREPRSSSSTKPPESMSAFIQFTLKQPPRDFDAWQLPSAVGECSRISVLAQLVHLHPSTTTRLCNSNNGYRRSAVQSLLVNLDFILRLFHSYRWCLY